MLQVKFIMRKTGFQYFPVGKIPNNSHTQAFTMFVLEHFLLVFVILIKFTSNE